MRRVPRERFLREGLEDLAYQDTPLPIESGQTISQPFVVAYMTQLLGLQGGERVLEVGTGSGCAAAVLVEIAGEVYTVERYGNLAETARERLGRLGYRNVHVLHGDGTRGWPSPVSPPGCGATARCARWSTGCASAIGGFPPTGARGFARPRRRWRRSATTPGSGFAAGLRAAFPGPVSQPSLAFPPGRAREYAAIAYADSR